MPDKISTSKEFSGAGISSEGNQIIKFRRPAKEIPEWVNSNEKIEEILLRSFPLAKRKNKQRRQAGRWARIINLYYKRFWSRGDIAAELGLSYHAVNRLIFRIRQAGEGRRTDGRPRRPPEIGS